MTGRRAAYVGIATGLLLLGGLLGRRWTGGKTPEPPPAVAPPGTSAVPPAEPTSRPLKAPPVAVAELGVLTERAEGTLADAIDREAVAGWVARARQCGDDAACEAVARALRDERTTHLQVAARADWDLDRIDLDAATTGLPRGPRDRLPKLARVVVVHVATATSSPASRALAARTAFAAAAAIATHIDGLVYDPVLTRIESAADFARHAPTEPASSSTFRRDRVQVLYQPRAEGIVRILTAGLARWGAPDVEAVAVPTAATARVAEIVLGVAEALAGGTTSGPVTLTRADLGRARGATYPDDAGLPDDREVRVDLSAEHPESGDPNDFIARIVPASGEGPMGYLELAERFFGSGFAASPGEDVLRAHASKARVELGPALTRWSARRADGARLLVRLPFPIPGDAGVESMWIDVTGCTDRTITGTLTDEPLAATDVAHGDSITRPRAAVEDVAEQPPSDR